mmetsp:Transcript_24728/g.79951  ORF Transcript_24728/g.79951 Transcript_24728/m.79951 type:complete len:227 (-) Transcript_24728:122-802(-)
MPRCHCLRAVKDPTAANKRKAASTSATTSTKLPNEVRTSPRTRSEPSRWSRVVAFRGRSRDVHRGGGPPTWCLEELFGSSSSSSTFASFRASLAMVTSSRSSSKSASSHRNPRSTSRPQRSSVARVILPPIRRQTSRCSGGYGPRPRLGSDLRRESIAPSGTQGTPTSSVAQLTTFTSPGSSHTNKPRRTPSLRPVNTRRWSPASTSDTPPNFGPSSHAYASSPNS